MRSKVRYIFNFLFQVDRSERLKLFFLTASFFFVIGGYTIIKELKDSIFLTVVGDDYLPWAKIISMLALIPAILFYSFLVDKIRRYHLLYFYTILYGVVGLIFAYYLGHPIIGITNTDANPLRLFGWLFYFFVEGYSPFIVSVFWAFANSITTPEAAKKNYGLMVSGSKLGGMLTSALAWYIFDCSFTNRFSWTEVSKHQILLAIASLILLFIPILISLLMQKVPGRFLHGYEAVYKAEKEKAKEEKLEEDKDKDKVNLFSGLSMILKQPYVFGIFSMIFFYEVINVVLSYQRLLLAREASKNISELSCVLFKQVFLIHFFGFIVSFLGTNALLRKFGEKKCLILVPVLTAILLFSFTFYNSLNVSVAVFIALRIINYALSYPLRESLYIPTIKEIKFKSKSWIDSFGSKFAKGIGSGYNIAAKMALGNFGLSAFLGLQSLFFGLIIGLWFTASYYLGRRYEKAIKKNEVIGF